MRVLIHAITNVGVITNLKIEDWHVALLQYLRYQRILSTYVPPAQHVLHVPGHLGATTTTVRIPPYVYQRVCTNVIACVPTYVYGPGHLGDDLLEGLPIDRSVPTDLISTVLAQAINHTLARARARRPQAYRVGLVLPLDPLRLDFLEQG